jgi:stage III sporulation protein SpoIIIAA
MAHIVLQYRKILEQMKGLPAWRNDSLQKFRLRIRPSVRCGAGIVTSAHAASLEEALARPGLRAVLGAGVVDVVALLGPRPGRVRQVWRREDKEGVAAWRCA